MRFEVPDVLRLADPSSRNRLIQLISRMDEALQNGRNVHVSLAGIRSLHPCGTLFFVAHMERFASRWPGRISLSYPKDDVVEQLFQHIGLLGHMGLSSRKTISADNVRHWHLVRGKNADISEFETLKQVYWDTLGEALGMALGGSMGEAVTNCVQHAYPGKESHPEKNWWMFAQYKEKELTVAIFDLGIGIVRSLRIKYRDRFKATFRLKHVDEIVLSAVLGSNRSRTQLPYRGKGLPEMLQNAKNHKIGGLLILSNQGAFLYSSADNREETCYYKKPLEGTLIQWTIPVNV
jgi:hypothetical protein